MKIFKTLSVVNLFIVLFIPPTRLLAQEDVSVEFTFNKPNKYVLEIRNMSDYRMTIWLNEIEGDIHSNLYFYAVDNKSDTVRVYYELWRDPKDLTLRFDPEEAYSISYKMSFPERFVKARVIIKYYVNALKPRGGFYEKSFNLDEVRNKAYIPQVLRE